MRGGALPEDLVIQHCSPTLAGLKTASLFSCDCPSLVEVKEQVRRLNRILVPKGLSALLLRCVGNGRALIYLYRPDRLEQDLSDERATDILEQMGYSCTNCTGCLVELVKRVRSMPEFPHEIGLFLGYPPEDVAGFIRHKGKCCKCVGCWKVYGDAEQAQRRFDQYQRCTRTYYDFWCKGISLSRLAVPVRIGNERVVK